MNVPPREHEIEASDNVCEVLLFTCTRLRSYGKSCFVYYMYLTCDVVAGGYMYV